MNLISLYRIARFFYKIRIPLLPKFIYWIQFLLFNSIVSYKIYIGRNTKFAYGGIAVVIHERVVIGDDCIIGSCVTIGGKSKIYDVPKIGNRVQISTGSKILGNITIGDDVVIGANAVVTKDVPSNCVVAGIPAKVIKSGINLSDYR